MSDLGEGLTKEGWQTGNPTNMKRSRTATDHPPPAPNLLSFIIPIFSERFTCFHAWRRSKRADWPSDIQTYQHNNHVWFAYRVWSYRNMHKHQQTMKTLLGCRTMTLDFFKPEELKHLEIEIEEIINWKKKYGKKNYTIQYPSI